MLCDPAGVMDLDPPYGVSNTFVRRSFLCSVTPLGSWPMPNNECVLLTPEGTQNIEAIMPARISTRRTAGRIPSFVDRSYAL